MFAQRTWQVTTKLQGINRSLVVRPATERAVLAAVAQLADTHGWTTHEIRAVADFLEAGDPAIAAPELRSVPSPPS